MLNVKKSAPYLSALGLMALTGCATPEYRVEKNHCEAEWILKIPPVFQQEVVTRQRNEERPSGETICTTAGAVTSCNQVMETVSVPYNAVETVDINARQRNPQIESCAARACAARYSNNACEV